MEVQQPTTQIRNSKFVLVLGYNGTGKTTFIRQLVEAVYQKCLIITPDVIEWQDVPENTLERKEDFNFYGVQKHIFNPDYTLKALAYFTKGIVVFDDCRAYLEDKTSRSLIKLLIRRRQQEIDIFAVGHGFTTIPPLFYTYCSELVLFKTVDNINRRKNVLKDYEKTLKAQQEVNIKAKKNPYFRKIIKY